MYIEYLSFYNIIIFFYNIFLKKINLKNKTVFYIDKTIFSLFIVKIISFFFKINFQYLDFKLIDIKDHNNELIRLRIFRKDLIELQHKIIQNNVDIFNVIKENTKLDYFYNYVIKSLSEGHLVMNPESLVRAVFIVQVILWHSKKTNISNINFYMSNRIWFDELKEYARNYNIELYKIPQILKFYQKKNFFIYDFLKNKYFAYYIYIILKNIIKIANPFVKYNIQDSKIYSFPLGNFNLENDGLNSDLFYFHNSNLDAKNIICEFNSKRQLNKLQLNNFHIINNKIYPLKNLILQNKNFYINNNKLSKLEYIFFKKKIKDYNLKQRNTYIFAKINNIRIFLTWAKYLKDHIAQHEAINRLGGIFAIWQYAFEGNPSTITQISTDLYFSNFSKNFFFNNNSKIRFFINTGFLMDYKFKLLKEKAQLIRNQILNNGAKNIVAIFDENSNQYQRWHTGHLLQAENYEIILKELLNNSNLGVIFKPKKPKTFRERIGDVNKLLVEAENTGRCYVYDTYTEDFNTPSPVLAGMSADICIHSHLCAGTAAIECALAKLPTILIDREGDPKNLLYTLSDQNIIFNNWNDAIYAVNQHFNSKNNDNNFGMWPEYFLNSLDNFRDGKAAFRMGEYLNTMINYIKQNKSRDEAMDIAAEIYTEKYGKDKISTFN